jgi:hypothetical protein
MEEPHSSVPRLERFKEHKFIILVSSTIVVSLFLVGIALSLYASSGAAQLDLSRVGYIEVRDKADRGDTFTGFPATGKIDSESLEQFKKLYDTQAKQALNFDSFGGTPMTDEALSLNIPAPAAE